jgi:hypothetical protein
MCLLFMQVIVKTRLGSMNPRVESFGNNRYFVFLSASDYTLGNQELLGMLSKYLGVPAPKLLLSQGESSENKIVEILH